MDDDRRKMITDWTKACILANNQWSAAGLRNNHWATEAEIARLRDVYSSMHPDDIAHINEQFARVDNAGWN